MRGEENLMKIGIPVIDTLIPVGIPRNSFIMIIGESGTGKTALMLHLLYARLKHKEPCIYICFDDSPSAIVQQLSSFGWSPIKYIEANLLHFIDCFSYRAKQSNTLPYVTFIENSQGYHSMLTDIIASSIEKFILHDYRGAIFLDSLTEFLTQVDLAKGIEAIKAWRAEFSKGHNIICFGTFHIGIKPLEGVEEMLEYIMDGIIDCRFEPNFMREGVLLKQLRIRKLKGAPHRSRWVFFTITRRGVTSVDVKTIKH